MPPGLEQQGDEISGLALFSLIGNGMHCASVGAFLHLVLAICVAKDTMTPGVEAEDVAFNVAGDTQSQVM